jgi:hypothetical protein
MLGMGLDKLSDKCFSIWEPTVSLPKCPSTTPEYSIINKDCFTLEVKGIDPKNNVGQPIS